MNKILFVILVTLSSMTNAGDEGRYSMLQKSSASGITLGIYILDSEEGKLKYCITVNPSGEDTKVICTEWSE